MSLTLEGATRSSRAPASRQSLLGAPESNPSGMLEMPILFRMPDVAELPAAPPAKTFEPKTVEAKPKEPASEIDPPAQSSTTSEPNWDASSVAISPLPTGSVPATESAATDAVLPSGVTATSARILSKKAESWFDTHTRLLVVCFLIALAAVVFMARQKRRQNNPLLRPAKSTTDWPEATSPEGSESVPLSLVKPVDTGAQPLASPQPPVLEATTALQATRTAVEPAESKSASVATTAPSAPSADDTGALFPWKQADDSLRTAAKTTPPALINRAVSEGGAVNVSPEPPPSIAPSATPPNRPRGYQYERTGSGLY